MSDEPKISKHHTGQHPALKSFRAFDIIPASKVKPGHTARPIINNPTKHFDTTLAPLKPTPAATVIPQPQAAGPEPASVTDPETPEANAVAASMPPVAEPAPETQAPTPKDTSLADTPAETSALPPASEPSESQPGPQSIGGTATDNNLSSILGQGDANSDKQASDDNEPANHSEEFKSALEEFANRPKADEAKPFVAVHKHDYLRKITVGFLWVLAAVVLAALVLDVLLDTGIAEDFYGLPHTNFF